MSGEKLIVMVSSNELIKRLRLGEDQQMEFKSVCRFPVVGPHVCAFLNARGGYVVCGMDEKGKIVGIADPEAGSLLEQKLMQHLAPKGLISVETHSVAGKPVLVIEVPAGKDIPYAFQDQVYVRDGLRTRKADIATVRDMVLRRQVEPERWERRFSSAEMETDLDENEIAATVQAADRNLRMRFSDPTDRVAVLQEMAVAQFGRLTNAGDVLFAATPDIRHPQVRVRAVCFAGGKADDAYRDDQTFNGPAVRVFEDVYRFVLRNIPTLAKFKKGNLERRNEPLYPPEAIREGLVNAFAHRDYADYKGGLAVYVYSDRLEILNSGGLPDGVTPDKLTRGHISVLRNPDVAHVFYLRGMMEKVGRGSLLIQDACRQRELPPPEWTSDPRQGVRLTFRAPLVRKETLQVSQQATQQVDQQVSRQALRLLGATRGEMSRTQLMHALGLKDRVNFARRHLEPAIEQGLVEMTQPDAPNSPTQRYRVTPKGKIALKQDRGTEPCQH